MGEEPPPWGGSQNPGLMSDEQSTTPVQTGGGTDNQPRRMRKFDEILEDEKKKRNTLTIKLTKVVKYEDGKETKAPSLNIEDISEFIFDVIKLEMKDCAGLALTTPRYDTKEISLKPGVDPNKYITKSPIEFKGHMITINQLATGTIKVTFKNVPINIPDEEIINLCEVYGTPVNNVVNYEQMPRAYRGFKGPNRSVIMKMNPGKQFENFYWMEGPLEEDMGCRITVLHSGQEAQCSHCLRRGNCPARGNGRACQNLNTQRGKISDYMRYLKESHNYMSLKMRYKLKKEEDFPALGQNRMAIDGFNHMVEVAETEQSVIKEKKTGDGDEEENTFYAGCPTNVNPDDFEYEEDVEVEHSKVKEKVTGDEHRNILNVNPDDFEYDLQNDTVNAKNLEAFDKMIEEHPSVHTLKRDSKREKKIENLKKKIFDTLKVNERKKRDLSCDSVRSDCSGWDQGGTSDGEKRSDSSNRGATRPRSDDDEKEPDRKKSMRNSRTVLKPPKIVISKTEK